MIAEEARVQPITALRQLGWETGIETPSKCRFNHLDEYAGIESP
jgi:hypothetical protein